MTRFLLLPVTDALELIIYFQGSGQENCCYPHLIQLLLFIFVQNYNTLLFL